MVNTPTLTDYVHLIIALFGQFKQHRNQEQGSEPGRPSTFSEEMFIIFFIVMQFRHIYKFKAQWCWLTKYPEMLRMLGGDQAAASNNYFTSIQESL